MTPLEHYQAASRLLDEWEQRRSEMYGAPAGGSSLTPVSLPPGVAPEELLRAAELHVYLAGLHAYLCRKEAPSGHDDSAGSEGSAR